jgi:hypothetical protein
MGEVKTIDLTKRLKVHMCISCLICGDPVPLTEMEESALRYGHHIHGKVCDKCKAAILYMREQMEQKEN